ncbi:MAG TPA: beta-L-arabinofuranosidase domain-containing protein, partial [Bacteroidota bacterium]|nr:beta-L-arabinofuranosidase domain-containing protein [Bacteroidota bacterium]
MHRIARILSVAVAALAAAAGAGASTPAERVALAAPPGVALFDLSDVHLLEGPFRHAMEMDQAYILSLKPDRLLSRCREYAGLAPRDSTYGGWEREGLSSHFVGHYLSACALQFRATGDRRFLDRIEYVVDQLGECQKANGDGYVTGIPDGKRVFAGVKAGKIRASGFQLNGVWSPWYTIHKIMAGLRDAYLLAGVPRAALVLRGMADWALATTKDLPDSLFQRMLECEFGGMNEVLADVYTITGEKKYLDLAERFDHHAVTDPMARREDRLDGLHGNTTIPKLIGAARLYEITGEPRYHVMSEFFWETVTRNHSYAAGGHGEYEHFGAPRRLSDRLSEGTMETCNTYNMLKLTRFLFTQSPAVEYADFYERAVLNHILASQNPSDGMMCYFV